MAKSLTVLRPTPIHRRRDSQQMTQRCRFYIASVTALPPASSHLPGLCCSCHFCCCKPTDGVRPIWLKDWNWAEGAGTGTLTCPGALPEAQPWEPLPPHAQAATQQPQNGSVLRVSTQRKSTSLAGHSLPPPQSDGERSGDSPFPANCCL